VLGALSELDPARAADGQIVIEILEYLEKAGVVISLFAVALIVAGFVRAAWRYARRIVDTAREDNFNAFKVELGGSLLLGLEILVLADVIETITVTPTFESLAYLAAIVVVRTAVSWTLTLETEGRWPWQVLTEDRDGA
jgi:uncharacterized membrane protein